MMLTDLLDPARVLRAGDISDKDVVFARLAAALAQGDATLHTTILEGLRARERLGSTGLGHGVAVPHGRTPGLAKAAGAFLRLDRPIEFGAPDGGPVDLLFALAVPEHFTHQHLQLLAALAERFGDEAFRAALRRAPDAAALYGLFAAPLPAQHAA